jgi:acetyl-CoA synthetase
LGEWQGGELFGTSILANGGHRHSKADLNNFARFNARATLEVLSKHEVTTLCAPPTVWRFLILEDLAAHPVKIREALSAGEPLNPEVIERVQKAWGVGIRDGYGQTETTCQIGNSPRQKMKPGSMGRPMPGFQIALLDAEGREGSEGEISIALNPRPTGLMQAYLDDPALTEYATRGGYYRTGDVASRDEEGYITYVGRSDDVFKSSDYRISPFELESALIEHEAIAEAAVVPSPDPVRGVVPKGFVILRPGQVPSRELALEIFRFMRRRLAPYKRPSEVIVLPALMTMLGRWNWWPGRLPQQDAATAALKVELPEAEEGRLVGSRS